jgi:hypothetical protein
MMRTLGASFLGVVIAAAGLLSAGADKPEIKGGIEGKVKKVDVDKETLTVTVDGKQRTFTVTEDTTIVGPRGGLVRRRLKDPRFHEGLEITVVATGNTAKELHLGVDRRSNQEPKATGKGATKSGEGKGTAVPPEKPKKAEDKTSSKTAAKGGAPKEEEANEEDDEEFPGKVKSVDPAKRLLVITLLNGKNRSFLLAKDVKILVKGRPTKQGLEDPMLKAGIPITVVTDPGGRKVTEVRVAPAPAAKGKKAG